MEVRFYPDLILEQDEDEGFEVTKNRCTPEKKGLRMEEVWSFISKALGFSSPPQKEEKPDDPYYLLR